MKMKMIYKNEKLILTWYGCGDCFPTVPVVPIIRFIVILPIICFIAILLLVVLPRSFDTAIALTFGVTNTNLFVVTKFIVLTFFTSFILWTESSLDDSHVGWFTFCNTFDIFQWRIIAICGPWEKSKYISWKSFIHLCSWFSIWYRGRTSKKSSSYRKFEFTRIL